VGLLLLLFIAYITPACKTL